MNRTAAVIGLALSLSLHSGLFLLTGWPSQPVVATRLKVTMQQISRQPNEAVEPSAVISNPVQPRPRPAEPVAAPQRKAPEPLPAQSHVAPPPRPAVEPAEPAPQPAAQHRPAPPETKTTAPAKTEPAKTEPAKTEPAKTEPDSEIEPVTEQSYARPATREVESIPADESGELTPPVYIPAKRPYPRLAKQRGWEGTVELQVVITATGRVRQVTLEHSSGYPLLDRDALKQIRSARFKPARKQGKAVEMSVLLPVVFELE